MSITRLTAIPATIISGDTVAITLTVSEYDAPTWALTWALAGVDVTTVASADNGAAHDLDLSATASSALGAGLYQWSVRASDGTTATTVQTGVLTVIADLATMPAGEMVPWEVTQLAAVEAALSGTLSGEMRRMMIDGRQLETFGLDELWTMRSTLQRAVARLANGGQLPAIQVGRFVADSGVWS